MNKSKFVIADENGRELFKEYASSKSWYKYNKESKDEYACWDISYYSGSTLIIGEIKVRESYDSKAFIEWDYEEKKHKQLVKMRNKMLEKYPTKQIEIQYINIFKDENVKIWTTTDIEERQVPRIVLRPQTTYGKQEMVNKSVYGLGLAYESNRGNLTPIIYNTKNNDEEEEEEVDLPF